MRYLLTLVLLSALLSAAAYGGGQKEAAMTAAPRKLVLWDVQTTTTLKDHIDKATAQFAEANNIEFEVVHIQNDPYKTKLKVAIGAGDAPDIFHNWGGGPLKEYIDSGAVHSMESIKADLAQRYIPAAFDPATFDGTTYGAPYAGLTGVYFWYRKDVWAKYNLTPPKTQEELVKVAETLKANGIIPIALANKTKWPGSFYYMYLADRLGGSDLFLNALYRKGGVKFTDPSYVRAGDLLQQLVRADYFPKGFNGLDYDTGQSRTLLYTGRAGMMMMGSWLISSAKTESPETAAQLDFFPFPTVAGGKGDPTNLIGSPGQNYFSISEGSENKEMALRFMKEVVMNEDWVRFLGQNGYVPPVKEGAKYVSDPLLQKIATSFGNAGHVQVYYDQFLPPAMGEKHKDLVQALFALEMTPQQVADAHEKAIQEELAK
jgi:raffinose/stachyose/melibiose transport system substrate-binding protein